MDAKIVRKSETGCTIEIEIPYAETMLKSEELIRTQINRAGSPATGEALKQFDADGSPISADGQKMTSKGQIPKPHQTPYGEIRTERHVYQSSSGGRGCCPPEVKSGTITTATPKFPKTVSSRYADPGSKRVRKDLKDNHSREVSKSRIQNICEIAGSVGSVKEDKRTYKMPSFEKEVKSVSIGIDGTRMLTCEEGCRQAMVGTMALHDGDGTRLHTICGAAAPEYGKQIFSNRMENEIRQVKLLHPDAGYAGLADGAKDNRSFPDKHTDQQLIDFYHAGEYIGKVGNAAAKKSGRQEWTETTCRNLKHKSGAAEEILSEMRGCTDRRMSKEKKRESGSGGNLF